ncbi:MULTISPECIES: fumarylacetoacetate hydrolase family protein [Mesorhizobium]|uniref:fumarylacetoacetate hydrolase family protein n=1 Tax=Mesorhizobium TaxID=68287 RepID=UPI0010A95749|nr:MULTISPECIES: fumarylacetoacetate hydrolase family protein [Mesorhizobium]
MTRVTANDLLPQGSAGLLIGRVWSNEAGGPCPVLVDGDKLRDLSRVAPTVSGLLEIPTLHEALDDPERLPMLGNVDDFLSSGGNRGPSGALLAPCDLQAVKAAGVTFAGSALERVIEERANGDPHRAEGLRSELAPVLGDSLRGVITGSTAAEHVKDVLQERGMWSQYLEVAIGPDAEIFTKGQPMASVGCGAEVGINRISHWNNPEPEIVLVVNSHGAIRGATLGNDVNLRDVEGRSALLLGKAKDNHAACAVGPFIRIFDASFGLEDVERAIVSLEITGRDSFSLKEQSPMSAISRKPADLVRQTINVNHHYPDGLILFLGTMFAPVQDRKGIGMGFTHEVGDEVRISSPNLGSLINVVNWCDAIEPWTFGVGALMQNLARRGLLPQ